MGLALLLLSAGWFLSSWWSDCNSVASLPLCTHTHTHSLLCIHRYYSLSYPPSYLFLMLTCTQLHTHARTFSPMHGNSLKGFTHSYNTSLPPPLLSSLLLLLPSLPPSSPSLPATLPLGSVSRNGLKELAPCTWSALFTRTCMWASRGGLLRAESPSELTESVSGAVGSGQPSVSHLAPVSNLG